MLTKLQFTGHVFRFRLKYDVVSQSKLEKVFIFISIRFVVCNQNSEEYDIILVFYTPRRENIKFTVEI